MTYSFFRKISGAILCLVIYCVFAIPYQTVAGAWSPVPFTIDVSGDINGVSFSVEGVGTVDPIGTYSASLTFSNMPPNFHPVFMTAYTVSICCVMYAEERRGGMNFHTLLGDNASYDVVRNLHFPLTGDDLTISGTVAPVDGGFGFVGTIDGTASDPGDLTGGSHYEIGLNPGGFGLVSGAGSGGLLRSNGELPVEVQTSHSFDPTKILPFKQSRKVDETGFLDGLTYNLVLHSLVFRPSVGGFWVPVDKLGLLAPYIGLVSTLIFATVATAIYVKRVKRRKEKR